MHFSIFNELKSSPLQHTFVVIFAIFKLFYQHSHHVLIGNLFPGTFKLMCMSQSEVTSFLKVPPLFAKLSGECKLWLNYMDSELNYDINVALEKTLRDESVA